MISQNLKKRIFTSIFLISILVLIFSINFLFVYSLIVLGVLSLLEFLDITKKIIKKKITLYFLNLIFSIYLSLFCIAFLFFYSNFHLKIIIFLILICCIASDIGGYVFGNLFKGPKLTKISPNKTITGAFGSIIFSFIFISGTVYFVINKFSHEFIWISILTSLACQLGDLFFSYLKRKAKIKNTGNYLPGHGGILDRVDGILFGIPVGLITLIILH